MKEEKQTTTKNPNIFKRLRSKNDAMWARFYDPKTKIANKGKWYAIAPLLIIFVGAILLCIPSVGFNLGLDFTGGSVIRVSGFENQAKLNECRAEVKKVFNDRNVKGAQFMDERGANGGGLAFTVKYQHPRGADMTVFDTELKEAIEEAILGGTFVGVSVAEADSISASASSERILMTFIAIAVSIIAILIYMLFRFRFTSGVAAIVGLLHDALIVCAMCAIFRVQLNYVFVAAIITVVVYSLNNTLVLFDRVRHKEKFNESRLAPEQIVDASVKETFGRTLGTTVTTLVPVIALCCIGVPLIREFALPILFGLIAGTFSTIFVTTALYVRFESYRNMSKRHKEKQLKRKENLVSPD